MTNQTFNVILKSIQKLSNDDYTLVFSIDENFSFNPGQYVWLVLKNLKYPDPRGDRRALSIISSNHIKGTIQLLVRNSNSGYKRSLFSLKEGDEALIYGPYGSSYVIEENNSTNINIIAGGVGITPFLSIINSLDEKPKFDIRILRTFSPEHRSLDLEDFSKKCKQLGIEFVDSFGPFTDKLFSPKTDFKKDLFFISGPPGFVQVVHDILIKKGTLFDNMRFEEHYPEPEGNLTEEFFNSDFGTGKILLQAIIDSKSHTVITDANGKILFANPKAELNTGFKFSEMKGSTPRLWGGLMEPKFYASFWKDKQTSKGFDGELINRRKDGKHYTVIAHISPIFSEKNKVIGYIGTEEDVSSFNTQKEQLEKQNELLRETKLGMLNILEDLQEEKKHLMDEKAKTEFERNKLELLVDAIPIGVTVFDVKTNKLTTINKIGVNLLGNSTVDKPHFLTDAGQEYPEDEIPSTIAIKTKCRAVKDDLLVVDSSGNKVEIKNTSVPILNERDEIIDVVSVFEDVTREKQIDRMKTEFISLASHQLRTPLTAIKWFIEMLLNGDAGVLNDSQKEFALNISQSTERMIELVNALLNVSRIESGRIIIDPQPTEMDKLIADLLKELESRINEKKIKLEIDISPDLSKVNLDQKLIRQVYLNLLTNSIKYSPEKSTIKISIKKENEQIVSCVADVGVGIPKSEHDKIFLKFYRATNVVKKVTDGNGLGLYLVKAIVESSGGKIWFESEENKGATFWFSLPVSGMKKKDGEVSID